MADAKKCDRCGVLFEPYIKDENVRLNKESECTGYSNLLLRVKNIMNPYFDEQINIDLCKNCANSLNNWLKLDYDAKSVGDCDAK